MQLVFFVIFKIKLILIGFMYGMLIRYIEIFLFCNIFAVFIVLWIISFVVKILIFVFF